MYIRVQLLATSVKKSSRRMSLEIGHEHKNLEVVQN